MVKLFLLILCAAFSQLAFSKDTDLCMTLANIIAKNEKQLATVEKEFNHAESQKKLNIKKEYLTASQKLEHSKVEYIAADCSEESILSW
ncbi:MAG: hypothetical protein AB7I27_04890 [Bacteriovoracaceae bacterium]